MTENKQNVYDDFHAAGDWLVDNGVTTREQLGIYAPTAACSSARP